MPSNENNGRRESYRHEAHNEQPNEAMHELAELDLTSDNGRIGLVNFHEDATRVDNQNDAYYYPPTPHGLAPNSLPPDHRLPALNRVLAGEVLYRLFAATLSQQNNVPITIEQFRIPVFIFVIRLSGHTGDIKMVTLSNEGAAVSVNDVLQAVRVAIAGRQPAFAPASAMAQMGAMRLDERGRLVWSGFREGSEGVWELSLV